MASEIRNAALWPDGELKIENESWHTIDGKRINGKPTQKGVYIMNGKKTVL